MAVVKADAYGHGSDIIVPWSYAAGVRSFGVANVGEALDLRALLPGDTAIYLLSPPLPEESEWIVLNNFIPLVSSLGFARALSKAAVQLQQIVRCHVEIDTGIGRAGMPLQSIAAELPKIFSLPGIEVVGLATHFASADDDPNDAAVQLALFRSVIAGMGARATGLTLHAANSPGILNTPTGSSLEMIRPGLLLYGIEPMEHSFRDTNRAWKPVLSLYAKICLCRDLRSGDTISYGRTYHVPKGGGRYATLPIGYGDGYSRQFSSRGHVLIHGQKAPICGRVCMDQFVVDVTHIPGAAVGHTATLIGTEKESGQVLSASELAGIIATTPHEITTGLTARVKRISVP